MDNNVVFSPINITELGALIGQQVSEAIKNIAPIPPASPAEETPVLFPRMLEITGLKERTARAKIAAGEIQYYQQGGKLYFFESELIAYIKSGKVKTKAEIATEATDYLQNKNRRSL